MVFKNVLSHFMIKVTAVWVKITDTGSDPGFWEKGGGHNFSLAETLFSISPSR